MSLILLVILEMQAKAYKLATRLFPISAVALLCICSNRLHEQRRAAGPFAQLGVMRSLCTYPDGRTNERRAMAQYNVESRSKNLVYLCVGHPKSLKMVPFDRRHNFLFFVPTEVYAYLKPFRRYGVSKNIYAWNAYHIAYMTEPAPLQHHSHAQTLTTVSVQS